MALHHLDADAGAERREVRLESRHVARHEHGEVRLGDGRVATRDVAFDRRDLVRCGDRDETRLAGELRRASFVRRMRPAVHEDDGDALEALRARAGEPDREVVLVERVEYCAGRIDAAAYFDDARVERRGQVDPAPEQVRALLRADRERVAEAAVGHEQRARAATLEQRIGRDRRADAHPRDGGAGRAVLLEHAADAGHGRVVVAPGHGREQLQGLERAVGPAADDVGERAAAVDPEFPRVVVCHACGRRQPVGSIAQLNTTATRWDAAGSADA